MLYALQSGDSPVEYLESVSNEATTWTTDPHRAVHFLSVDMIPVTTVILRHPIVGRLKDNPTQSERNLHASIMEWFRQRVLPEEVPWLDK